MKIIYPFDAIDTQVGIEVTDINGIQFDNEGFPLYNIDNVHSTKIFKAPLGAEYSTVTLKNSFVLKRNIECFALFNITALSVRIKVFTDSGSVNEIYDSGLITTYYSEDPDYGTEKYVKNLWIEPDVEISNTNFFTIEITRIDDETPQSLGILRAGKIQEFPNPNWGYSDNIEDHAIVKQLKNGADFTKVKNQSKSPSGSILLKRNKDELKKYTLFLDMYRLLGKALPFPSLPLDGETDFNGNSLDNDICIWARFAEVKGTVGSYSYNTIDFTLKEFL